jgi:hypothetical protein
MCEVISGFGFVNFTPIVVCGIICFKLYVFISFPLKAKIKAWTGFKNIEDVNKLYKKVTNLTYLIVRGQGKTQKGKNILLGIII